MEKKPTKLSVQNEAKYKSKQQDLQKWLMGYLVHTRECL
jgi:hypothetical protein